MPAAFDYQTTVYDDMLNTQRELLWIAVRTAIRPFQRGPGLQAEILLSISRAHWRKKRLPEL